MRLKITLHDNLQLQPIETRPLRRRRHSTCPIRRSGYQIYNRIEGIVQHMTNLASHRSPYAKRYQALYYQLHVRNGVLYTKWESDDGRNLKRKLPRYRILEVLNVLHNSLTGGHFRVMKNLQKILLKQVKIRSGEMVPIL